MRPFRKGCLSWSGCTWSSYFWNGYYELQQKRYAPYQAMPNQPHHVFSLENIWVSLKFKCIRNICEFYFYCKFPCYLEFNDLRQLRGPFPLEWITSNWWVFMECLVIAGRKASGFGYLTSQASNELSPSLGLPPGLQLLIHSLLGYVIVILEHRISPG